MSSPGRSRTYVANPDSKSGGPCRQTNRGMWGLGYWPESPSAQSGALNRDASDGQGRLISGPEQAGARARRVAAG